MLSRVGSCIIPPMVGALDTQAATTADGRTVTFAEWGDRNGFPVFSLHGAPGSRLLRHYDEAAFVEIGARVITYDRPGYGGSDRKPGRQVVDCVGDVSAIADSLGLDRFAVIGTSCGGPHSLALAARLPERVTRVTCSVGVVPFDTPGFDWFEGMDPLNVTEIGWALEGESVLAQELEREAGAMLDRVSEDPAKLIADDWQLSDADRAELARAERHEIIRQGFAEAFRNGVWGWVDDDLSLTRPWGFDVSEIHVPTRVAYGMTDDLVPRQHGAWLAGHVPNAEIAVDEEGGHLPHPDSVIERYSWLVKPI